MRKISNLILILATVAACTDLGDPTSQSDWPVTGEYRREATGGYASTVSATVRRNFRDADAIFDLALGPDASSCQDKNISISNGKIEIETICISIGVLAPVTIKGEYGQDFVSFRTVIHSRTGDLHEDYRYNLVKKPDV